MEINKKDIKRFWFGVQKTKSCWNWIKANRGNGYGAIRINKKTYNTHRISWIIHFGQIPNHLCVLHTCDNRKCIKPTHLWLGTKTDNNRDMFKKGRNHNLRNYLKKYPEKIARGENSGNSKLTEKQVLEIRRLWEKKIVLTKYELAKIFQVDEGNIRGILKRLYWKHI